MLQKFIDKNLMAIIAVGLGLYGGYITGQVTTGMKIAALEATVAELRTNDRAGERRIDRIECLMGMGECKR